MRTYLGLLALMVLSVCGCGGKDAGAFEQANLTGTWNSESLTVAGSASRCGYASTIIDGNGAGTGAYHNSDGTSGSGNYQFALADDGAVTLAGSTAFRGGMDSGKKLIVTTDTWDGAYAINVLVKGGGAFALADLVGTWSEYTFTRGATPEQDRIAISTVTVDGSGHGTVTWTGAGGSSESASVDLAIDADGIVTESDAPSFHGVMSQDKGKGLVVFNDLWDGDPDFGVMIKNSTAPTPAALAGTWHTFDISGGQSRRWRRGLTTLDATGTGSMSYEFADGTTGSMSVGFTVIGAGTIQGTGSNDFQGTMLPGNTSFVGVLHLAEDAPALLFAVKAP
jgi:hypothetical protein